MTDIKFNGYFPETFEFLSKLSKNNSKKWFDKHRNKYEEYILDPSTNFVLEIKQFFNFVNQEIIAEPKFNKSFVRINKDMRFAKKPYKDYFLIRFGKKKWDSEFFLVINQDDIGVGLFINNEKKEDTLFTSNIINYPEEFIQYSKKYLIDKKFDVYELMKMEKLVKGFKAEKDMEKLLEIKYFLIRKSYPCDKKVIFSRRFFIEIFKIYSQLYPVYLYATSNTLLNDIKEYDEKVGHLISG
jgi:uncharacterized protein (TIGR02453 family)